MINVERVMKTYPTRGGDVLILDDINFKVHPGEKIGILGRNGAGKSTLVRLLSGAERPTSCGTRAFRCSVLFSACPSSSFSSIAK